MCRSIMALPLPQMDALVFHLGDLVPHVNCYTFVSAGYCGQGPMQLHFEPERSDPGAETPYPPAYNISVVGYRAD